MGNRDNRNLFYISVAIAAVLLLMFWGIPNSSQGTKGFMAWDNVEQDAELETAQYRMQTATPKASWKRVSLVKKKKPSENTYQPTASYVNSYTPNTEYQHPLVASTKYISKKDQKKKKKGKKKQSLQANKKDEKSKGREFGFSDSDELNETDSPVNSAAVFNPTQTNTNNTANINKKKEEEEENLNTFEYWEKPIFVDEDQAMVSKLISSYQIRKVSNNVFYELVTEMRSDERTQIREFGLVALSSTPSARSFSELTTMKHTDPDTELRNAAGREVTNYYQEKKLSHVVSALKVSPQQSPRTAFEALVVLDDATKKYSDLGPFDENSPNPPPANLNAAAVTPRFEQALTVIEQTRLTESPDPKIKAQAVKTADSLNKFVGTTVTTL